MRRDQHVVLYPLHLHTTVDGRDRTTSKDDWELSRCFSHQYHLRYDEAIAWREELRMPHDVRSYLRLLALMCRKTSRMSTIAATRLYLSFSLFSLRSSSQQRMTVDGSLYSLRSFVVVIYFHKSHHSIWRIKWEKTGIISQWRSIELIDLAPSSPLYCGMCGRQLVLLCALLDLFPSSSSEEHAFQDGNDHSCVMMRRSANSGSIRCCLEYFDSKLANEINTTTPKYPRCYPNHSFCLSVRAVAARKHESLMLTAIPRWIHQFSSDHWS